MPRRLLVFFAFLAINGRANSDMDGLLTVKIDAIAAENFFAREKPAMQTAEKSGYLIRFCFASVGTPVLPPIVTIGTDTLRQFGSWSRGLFLLVKDDSTLARWSNAEILVSQGGGLRARGYFPDSTAWKQEAVNKRAGRVSPLRDALQKDPFFPFTVSAPR